MTRFFNRFRGVALVAGACALLADGATGRAQTTTAALEERITTHVNPDRSAVGSRIDWIKKADRTFPLKPPGTFPLGVTYTHNGQMYEFSDYFLHDDTLAFVVLKGDQIFYEKYLHNTGPTDRFLSMSVAKSIVSVLVGVAVDERKIHSVKDRVTQYLPALSEGGYKDATLEDLLHMASGVAFSEDEESAAGLELLNRANRTGSPGFAELAASLRSETQPGSSFHDQSINTQVLGMVIEQATGVPLNKYAEEKLWRKIGTESDAFFVTGEKQTNIAAYGSFSATLRDYARFGLMAMRGGELGGRRVVSQAWMRASATPPPFAKPHMDEATRTPRNGYGYQWWLPYGEDQDRAFQATGAHGQTIYINPVKGIVIAQFSAWPSPGIRPEHRGEHTVFYQAIIDKLTK